MPGARADPPIRVVVGTVWPRLRAGSALLHSSQLCAGCTAFCEPARVLLAPMRYPQEHQLRMTEENGTTLSRLTTM